MWITPGGGGGVIHTMTMCYNINQVTFNIRNIKNSEMLNFRTDQRMKYFTWYSTFQAGHAIDTYAIYM